VELLAFEKRELGFSVTELNNPPLVVGTERLPNKPPVAGGAEGLPNKPPVDWGAEELPNNPPTAGPPKSKVVRLLVCWLVFLSDWLPNIGDNQVNSQTKFNYKSILYNWALLICIINIHALDP
jgi:hypothetical protein